jgi:hypothetical protein
MSVYIKNSVPVQTDITAIIRSAGERTTDFCHQLLRKQVAVDNIVVIDERPFTRALQRSFEIGIAHGQSWTLCVDADMLLRRASVQTLLTWAQAADARTFQVQGDLFDKLLGKPRQAGPRLYRTALLPQALSLIPPDRTALRPETVVTRRMTALGHAYLYQCFTLGLHDFEQYYRDIYRKAFVHGHKHNSPEWDLESLWQRLANQDPDYQIALWGLREGRRFEGMVPLDTRCFPPDLGNLLGSHGWREKRELTSPASANWDIDTVLIEYVRMRAAVLKRDRADEQTFGTRPTAIAQDD